MATDPYSCSCLFFYSFENIVKNGKQQTRHHARFGKITEYKLPTGKGARFSEDGKTFIGLIEWIIL